MVVQNILLSSDFEEQMAKVYARFDEKQAKLLPQWDQARLNEIPPSYNSLFGEEYADDLPEKAKFTMNSIGLVYFDGKVTDKKISTIHAGWRYKYVEPRLMPIKLERHPKIPYIENHHYRSLDEHLERISGREEEHNNQEKDNDTFNNCIMWNFN